MKVINIFLILTMFFSSCSKVDCPTQGAVNDEGEIIGNVSFEFDTLLSSQEYIIRNTNENTVGAKIKIGEQPSFDTINFSNYSLIGKRITFTSEGKIKRRIVSINNQSKLVHCTIEIRSCGMNKVGLSKHTWMLTNKIPDDYDIIFEVKEK